MTIATFCRDELLAHGPLTLDELGARASAAGVTRAADPASAVRTAMRGRELELRDGRWVSPLFLLEGRCLTTPVLPIMGGDVPRDSSEEDLELLHRAARLGPIPLAGGGYLRQYGYHRWWKCTATLPEPGEDELLCFRVDHGELAISTLSVSELVPLPSTVAEQLDLAARSRRSWYADTATAVATRLAELVLEDPQLLRTPAPPLSRAVSTLGEQAQEREMQRRREPDWLYEDRRRPLSYPLHLSDEHAWKLDQLADDEQLLPYEWVERAIDLRYRDEHEPRLRLLP